MGELELDGVFEDDAGPIAEVIEEGCGGPERRRERVDSRRVAGLAEGIDEPSVWREVGGLLAVGVRQPVPPCANESLRERRRALERELARRENDQLLERRLRALRHGVERAERLDLVAEELDASGLLGRCGVDVDDASAAREGPRFAHLGHRLVSEIEEPGRRFGPRQALARAERATAAGKLLRRDGVLEQGTQARDDSDRGLRRREPP